MMLINMTMTRSLICLKIFLMIKLYAYAMKNEDSDYSDDDKYDYDKDIYMAIFLMNIKSPKNVVYTYIK